MGFQNTHAQIAVFTPLDLYFDFADGTIFAKNLSRRLIGPCNALSNGILHKQIDVAVTKLLEISAFKQ